jgi:hypothetical protein
VPNPAKRLFPAFSTQCGRSRWKKIHFVSDYGTLNASMLYMEEYQCLMAELRGMGRRIAAGQQGDVPWISY